MRFLLRLLCLVSSICAIIGCAREGADIPGAAAVESTPAVFNTAGAPTVEFSVPDMMCPEGCGEKTKEILSGQPGAKEVLVNFEAKTATVAIEDGKFNADEALAALVDHGFDHSALKGGASAKEAR